MDEGVISMNEISISNIKKYSAQMAKYFVYLRVIPFGKQMSKVLKTLRLIKKSKAPPFGKSLVTI